jgi:hypothetical protein
VAGTARVLDRREDDSGALEEELTRISDHDPTRAALEQLDGQPVVYGRALKVNRSSRSSPSWSGRRCSASSGALLAIPIAAAIQILLRDWWTHRPKADVTDVYAPAHDGSSVELVRP